MYCIDLLAVENEDASSTRSGDAIVLAFTPSSSNDRKIVVIDGGYDGTGDKVAEHVLTYYGTSTIDLVISTHPDGDHLNGLVPILETCVVKELMIHQPDRYRDASSMGNHDKLVEVLDLARKQGTDISEPFTGESRYDGAVRILGPSATYYLSKLDEIVDQEQRLDAGYLHRSAGTVLAAGRRVLERVISHLPFETLGDDDDHSARNQSSVITLLQVDDRRFLFTGDAGIEALDQVADEYERVVGPFAQHPLKAFQAPHHGSKHNLGPTILNRILGDKDTTGHGSTYVLVSSSKSSEKHPSPKITNAAKRRGASPYATEGQTISFFSPGAGHPNWHAIEEIPPLAEED